MVKLVNDLKIKSLQRWIQNFFLQCYRKMLQQRTEELIWATHKRERKMLEKFTQNYSNVTSNRSENVFWTVRRLFEGSKTMTFRRPKTFEEAEWEGFVPNARTCLSMRCAKPGLSQDCPGMLLRRQLSQILCNGEIYFRHSARGLNRTELWQQNGGRLNQKRNLQSFIEFFCPVNVVLPDYNSQEWSTKPPSYNLLIHPAASSISNL